MKRLDRKRRLGVTLLEVIIASTILTTVVSSVTVLLRSGRDAWEANNNDQERLEAAHATVRHIVRRVRQSTSVVAMSGPSDDSGNISLLMESGDTYVYDHDSSDDSVDFGLTTAASLLGENITKLKFTGYEADGTTSTTVVGDVQSIKVEAEVQLPRATGGTKTVTSWAWIRTW